MAILKDVEFSTKTCLRIEHAYMMSSGFVHGKSNKFRTMVKVSNYMVDIG